MSSILMRIEAASVQGIDSIFLNLANGMPGCAAGCKSKIRVWCVSQGEAMGIDRQGAYLVNTDHGLRAVHAGDLSLRVKP